MEKKLSRSGQEEMFKDKKKVGGMIRLNSRAPSNKFYPRGEILKLIRGKGASTWKQDMIVHIIFIRVARKFKTSGKVYEY